MSTVSLFSDLKPNELALVLSKLKPEIFLPSDTIIYSGGNGNALYFIASGTVAVYTHSGKEVNGNKYLNSKLHQL